LASIAIAGVLAGTAAILPTSASATGLILSANGFTQIGIQDTGNLDANTDAGFVGIGYNFTGQGGRTGMQDALTPGCPCESWGVSASGFSGQIGDATGNSNIGLVSTSTGVNSFTSVTNLTTLPGLTVTQAFTRSAETATGGLFQDHVTITNGTGGTVTDVRYARAMDWDVPPTEFSEVVTHKGTTTTTELLHSTDNGFSTADPIAAMSDGGICGPVDSDGTTGPCDHGSLFVFGFGSLANGATKEFNIFYGAGANLADGLTLLGMISPELYSIGQSSGCTGTSNGQCDDLPPYLFAFNGVGGSVVVPPPGVPEPATLSIIGLGLAALGLARRRKSA